ncbi:MULTISPECIES: primase-helicase family protein, partial [unclassified Myroides]|uniref:primase-helicase family protein n=1 Tax=unclassified Myroides TaxID=2642485 RepID=UPI003D2F7041
SSLYYLRQTYYLTSSYEICGCSGAYFVNANNIVKYVRLHDAVIVLETTEITQTEFETVKFNTKEVKPPAVINNKKSFYQIDADNRVITQPVFYKEFFEQENFIRITEAETDKITIFKDSNNVVKPFNYKTDTVSYLSEKINEYDTTAVQNQITRDINNIINGGFLLMKPKKLIYYTDLQNEFGIPFKNGFCKYTKGNEQTEILEYEEVNGFFAQHPTQEKNFEFKEYVEPCEFERFLTMVSVAKDPIKETLTATENKIRMQFFKMFGYLCHSYKDQSFSPAIILSDEGANDISRKGGRGKTLITKALQNVRNTKIKGGNEFDGSYRHKFADLEQEHKIYVIDDVLAGFNYDDLYTNIIGDITCERKGKTAITIPFKDAPKFVITTNWAVRYDAEATSTHRRFLEFKLTDYFNLDNTPNDVFNRRLFEDWDSDEWNRFYNFVYACVGYYLEFGLDAPKYDKEEDNYRAYFSNDVITEEFERVFSLISNKADGFNATDFLNLYKSNDNPLRNESYFHHKNIKKFVDAYVKYKKLNFEYNLTKRKWFNKSDF